MGTGCLRLEEGTSLLRSETTTRLSTLTEFQPQVSDVEPKKGVPVSSPLLTRGSNHRLVGERRYPVVYLEASREVGTLRVLETPSGPGTLNWLGLRPGHPGFSRWAPGQRP